VTDIFIGRDGIRAGWRIAIFLILVGAEVVTVGCSSASASARNFFSAVTPFSRSPEGSSWLQRAVLTSGGTVGPEGSIYTPIALLVVLALLAVRFRHPAIAV
jgi:hypothetical protein